MKAATFLEDTLQEKMMFNSMLELEIALEKQAFDNVIISSVHQSTDKNFPSINVANKQLVLNYALPLPVKLLYRTPETLGVDRIAGACGASFIFPDMDCLVIDMGTCINYEFVDSKSNYHGGAISPGVEMRMKAMNTFTTRLPLIKVTEDFELIGDSTESCMQSGVVNGVLGEISGVISKYLKIYPALKVILCGGDAALFENQLKPPIFAAPDLVLMGLNRILRYNAA